MKKALSSTFPSMVSKNLSYIENKKRVLFIFPCQQAMDNLKNWISMRKFNVRVPYYLFENKMLSSISVRNIEEVFLIK